MDLQQFSESAQGAAAPAPAMERPAVIPDSSDAAPVAAAERITALDALRGFSLLGILLMNIVAMGLYSGSYDNPTVAGGATGLNLAAWTVMHVLAEGKMRCLFSLVFGASVILLTSRLEKRGDAADIYYRRTLWLLLFGIIHAYLLWMGDILYPYALCGLLLYPFRKIRARRLLIIGSVLLVFTSASYIGKGFMEREMITKGLAALEAEKAGKQLTPEQQDAKIDYERWRKFARPSAEELKKDVAEWHGSPLSVIKARAKLLGFFHGMPYYHPMNWDIWSMMFLGMGLFKLGVLSAELSSKTYVKMALLGYLVGIPLNSYTAWLIIKSNFDPVVQSFTGTAYDIGRLSIALGHLGMLMLLCKSAIFPWLSNTLGAVGQLAFSNYVMQSVITAFLFTGYGFKLYGQLERHQLYYVVAAIWVVQMIVSPIWLRYFRFGPLEWGWRSLTYWKRQPMRLQTEATQPVAA
jgi:uncharacterized protein